MQTTKYKTKLKRSFHRQNLLFCCLIRSLGIDFEILSSLKAQSKCAVTDKNGENRAALYIKSSFAYLKYINLLT